MKKKQTKNTYAPLEKILTIAGLSLIVIGIAATIFGSFVNARFISDPFFLLYYLRLALLLGGGFAIGYFIARKKPETLLQDRLFNGVVLALLVAILYQLTFYLQVVSSKLFVDNLAYPWGKILFLSAPITALAIGVFVALFNRRNQSKANVGKSTTIALLASFLLIEGYNFGYSLYMLARYGLHDDTPVTLLTNIFGYVTMPIVIAIIAYLSLGKVKEKLQRAFYAAFIGILYGTLTHALFEFRTDASSEATNNFIIVLSIVTLSFVGILLWRARKAVSGISR